MAMGDAGFIVPDAIRQGWAAAYPGVDIDRETAKAFAWCQNNPRKAPKKEYGRFLNRWMGLATPFMTAAEQAADDAELIRGAEDKYPDPDERAAFF
ncbi:MAG: hypothetical protein LUE17_05375 [Planctomycetaceae bacterium]|nr:hypothetical protein [Planctomycetaceae bacterium]